MKKVSHFITKYHKIILLISILLLIPATIGYISTKINYDILVYLPDNIDTIKGQNILKDDFKTGSFAFVITENLNSKSTLKLEDKIKNIDTVNEVVSIYDITDVSIPIEMLPDSIQDKIVKDNSTLILVTFEGSTSEESTIEAVRELRKITKHPEKVSSMTSMVIDTMDLSNQEIAIYVTIAVIFCLIVLSLFTESYLTPILLLFNIGVAIVYNLGSNIIFGEIIGCPKNALVLLASLLRLNLIPALAVTFIGNLLYDIKPSLGRVRLTAATPAYHVSPYTRAPAPKSTYVFEVLSGLVAIVEG